MSNWQHFGCQFQCATLCASSLSSCGTLWRSKRVTSFTFCVSVYKEKKNKKNHKKAHQRLIEKSLVRLRLPLSRAQTTPAPVITSPVARRSHQLALEAVALIAFAQPGQARPARQPSFPLLLPLCSPHGILKLYDTQLQHIKKQIKSHKRFLCCLPRATLKLFNYIFVYYKNITPRKFWSERDRYCSCCCCWLSAS